MSPHPTERRESAALGVMVIPILEEVRGQDRAWAVSGIAGLELTIGRRRSQEPDRETRGREPDTER